ncbi:MAG: flavodoxin-dependent (E)-4-hydroxy-3-methylbut-2-enyl-diphosphate synthase [Treponema sp.]|nr:flavodoxin-dependent (E)-4-hydroxy-3-methylbut-2-enyl-diphosphate synthase [Treponema sp.]
MGFENQRRKTKTVRIGGFDNIRAVYIGGDSPVVVQTMWKDRLCESELEITARRITKLGDMGCQVLRFAVPSVDTAETLGRLAKMIPMPLVADIHFDHRIALRCMDFPIAKIRINPGNIGKKEKVREVVEKASSKGIPIRIGVNAGSLPRDLAQKVEQGMDRAVALVEAAERELAVFDEFGFDNVLVSMKASEIADTVSANRIFSGRMDVPLHVGVTEAGPLVAGVVRSSAALAPLLAEGIGDTVRVSLSDSVENEVIAAREICKAAAELASLSGMPTERLLQGGVRVVSCPKCGRHGFDTHGFMDRWLTRLYAMKSDITVAVMGCEVNGPGEARHADIGITGAGNKVLIFRHGKVVRTVSAEEADGAFDVALQEAVLS